ncbi:NAD-dependent epimerase/dehydratase family protein [Egicoccus halophilus]|uniref:NAD-dependent epimerase n=1 Tax=Egicoccus halophilus TaxID=1670830 RepID=A0A8J3AGN8_9ACTN|nr:NAD-dependent epimerase/dehydratase family protein [Egicoccus halophilus]GGI09068.1 NAD-dependent epimerase [Egicoccus halophilus]
MRVTILGATGGIGRTLVDELLTRGHEVTAVSRSVTASDVPPGTRVRAADLTDAAAARGACAGAEVVVMAANLPYADWHAHLLPTVGNALDAAVATDARFVMVDNLYAYGAPAAPITDRSPEAGPSRKAAVRRRVAALLLAAHDAGRTGVTIGRFSDYYGPHGQHSLLGMLMIDPVLRGRRPRAFVAADQPHTFAYLPDAAAAFATLVERPEADGRSWILPAAEPITQREVAALVTDAVGVERRLAAVPPAMLWAAGLVDRQLREAREQVPQFDRPYVALGDEFTATFGPHPLTPHPEAVRATVAARRDADRPLTGAGSA